MGMGWVLGLVSTTVSLFILSSRVVTLLGQDTGSNPAGLIMCLF